jgi:hypothetical protein
VTDIDALTAALEVYFSTGAKIDDARFEAVDATFCEIFAISPVELGKRIEAICDTSAVVGAQELPPIGTGAGRVEPIRYQGRGRGVGRSASLPAACGSKGKRR